MLQCSQTGHPEYAGSILRLIFGEVERKTQLRAGARLQWFGHGNMLLPPGLQYYNHSLVLLRVRAVSNDSARRTTPASLKFEGRSTFFA